MWLIDDREPDGIEDSLNAVGVPAKRQRLDVGDYSTFDQAGELVLLTRKASDLCTSVNDGHIQEEFDGCINAIRSYGGGTLFWLLEGVWAPAFPGGKGGLSYFKRTGAEWFRKSASHGNAASTLAGMQVSAQTAGVQFVWTPDLAGTVDMLVTIYNRAQQGWPTHFTNRLTRKKLLWSKNSKVANLMGLWPRLTERQAQALLSHFGTIEAVVLAWRTEDLREVKGIGKQSIANLTQVMT